MTNIRPILYTIVFTGLIILGAQITVSLGPVPFVLSDFFVLLAGFILGKKYAPISVGAYLVLGAAGLPIFAGGGGGINHLIGPTGGYLFGYLLASYLVGTISHQGPRSILRDVIAVLVGYLTIYSCGVFWLKFHRDLPWEDAIWKGALDFRIPMVIKSTSAVLLALLIRKLNLGLRG